MSSSGETDIVDITGRVQSVLRDSGLASGVLTAFVPGSTAGITTIEYESGLLKDLEAAYERIAPTGRSKQRPPRGNDLTQHAPPLHVRRGGRGVR